MTSNDLKIPNLQNISTPFGVPLSAIYKQSFAYITVKDRLPVILTKIIDTFCRNKNQIIDTYGQDAEEDIKHIIGFISQLKNEIVTNKTLKPLRLNSRMVTDAKEWNKYLEYRIHTDGEIPTWFNTIWLYCECYMYRVLAQEISLTSSISNYDPFEINKQDIFTNSLDSMDAVASHIKNIIQMKEYDKQVNSKNDFLKLLKLSLWSNRQDLSISVGSSISQIGNPLDIVESLNDNIIANDSECAWYIIKEKIEENVENKIHVILDNAGYELFIDMCLAAFLVTILPKIKIVFHVKVYPWYVSDTTINDFHWTLEYMNILNRYPDIQALSNIFHDYLTRQIWYIQEEPYWTGPYDFTKIKEKAPLIYDQFSNAKLIIFKGDLNYRKLLGDINFEYITNFTTALGDFHPTNILCLRTVKSDICVGLPLGAAESLCEKDKDWMTTGNYGVIQVALNL